MKDTFKIQLVHRRFGAKEWENCSIEISDGACLRFSVNEGDPLERRKVVIGWEDIMHLTVVHQSRVTGPAALQNFDG
jgi:hypothetical protein